MFHRKVVEKIKTHIICSITFFNCAVYTIMCKNIVGPGRPQMKIMRMCIACWIIKATDTHSEYMIIIASCNNDCTNAPQYNVIRTMPVFAVSQLLHDIYWNSNEEFVVCPSGPVPLGFSNKGKKSERGSIMNSRNEKCIRSCHREI